jgi:Bacteriophage head to tail connecting protein.
MLTAKELWQLYDGKRTQVLQRARDCSALTIPALLPPQGHTQNSALPTPYQSLGARGVNNLTSKILLALFPPGQAMFRWTIEPKAKEELSTQKKITQAQALLSKQELQVTEKIEGLSLRKTLVETVNHLVVAGNVLYNKTPTGSRMFRLDQYVICRDPEGNPVEAVIKESVSPIMLKPDVIEACKVDASKRETPVDVYTVIRWDNSKVIDYQEINDVRVPNSTSVRPKNKSRWFPLRWRAVPGEDYGRGHCEEYLGDLRTLEGLTMAISQFAAAAARILFRVSPGAITDFEELTKLESGQSFTGNENDVTVLQIEKAADFQIANTVAEKLELRLSHSFLLKSGTIRDAERVTAEEIRELAQELEDALGGVYTVLADEFQLPFVRLMIHEMQQARELPALPEKVVNPIIVTGFQALGRNHAVNKLRAFLNDLKALDPELTTVNKLVVARRLGVGWGVEDLDELLLTEEDMQSTTENNVAANIVDKTAAPVAGAVAKAVAGQ